MGGGVTGTAEDGTRLHRLLGGEPTAWLVQRARDRLEAGEPADRDRDPDRRDCGAAASGRTANRQAAPFWHVAVGVAARGGPGPA